jgi:adenosine deaminase
MLEYIKKLPKTETHLHIEGALPWELLESLDSGKFSKTPDSWHPNYKFGSFKDFEDHLIEHALHWFTSAENYHKAAKIIFNKHLEQNVRYVETSFHAGIIEFLKIPGPEIIDAILSAVPKGLEVKVFMGMARNGYSDFLGPILEESIHWEKLTGIDLHGVEVLPIEPWTEDLWKEARKAGKYTKAHAGEFGGAEYVKDAIHKLGVKRVQHGVRAMECSDTVQLLIDEDVTLDICPISNVKLNVVDRMEDHPIRKFHDAGVRCTINTDDPFSFGNKLEDEYEALAKYLNFSEAELAKIARNGFEIALISEDKREELLKEFDNIAGFNA